MNGYQPYPEGKARNGDSVQRGSVQALSLYPGDPGTPGKPSYRNATRLKEDEAESLAGIPSLPLSWKDAQGLLQRIQGKGKKGEEMGKRWKGGIQGVEYWTGEGNVEGQDQEVVEIENNSEMKVRDIWNTYLYIPGVIESDKVVIGEL